MLREILENVKTFEARIIELRAASDYWPQILYKNNSGDDTIYASTLVRIFRDDRWYVVHCVDSQSVPIGSHNVEYMLERMIFKVHLIQNFHIISERDEVDKLQISEQNRLKERYPLHFPNKEKV